MNQLDPATVLPEVEKMLYKLAWKYARTHNIPFDECLSSAHYGFMKAVTAYSESRGTKLSSYIHFRANNRLMMMVQDRYKHSKHVTDLDEAREAAAPPQTSPSLELLEGLSDDAKEILRLLFETPEELSEMTLGVCPRKFIQHVIDYLVRKHGHKKRNLVRARREIRRVLNDGWASC